MSRSPSVSRGCAVPFCGTQVPPLPQARTELATLMGVAADRVAVPVAKFSVSFRRNSWPGLLFCQVTKRPGVPSVGGVGPSRSEEHTSELQSRFDLVCRLLLEKKK